MITPQFTYDNTELSQTDFLMPEWQMELGKKELQNIAEGNTELMEWNVAKKGFKL